MRQLTQAIQDKVLVDSVLRVAGLSRPEKSLPKNGNFYAT